MFQTDDITGQLRIVAPNRAKRLGPRPEGCPFCEGNEEHTPPEIARVENGETWHARSVPNLFPLGDVHEVLIPTPRHATSVRELTSDEWEHALTLWVARLEACRGTLLDRYAHLFVNDGKDAGASLEHTHAQLLLVPRAEQVLDLTRHTQAGSCALCSRGDWKPELHVHSADGFSIHASATPRTGHGLLVFPENHIAEWVNLNLSAFAQALRRAATVLVDGPFNAWVVWDPTVGSHIYAEFVPRNTIPAGVELALGVGVSTVDPAAAALAARQRVSGSVS